MFLDSKNHTLTPALSQRERERLIVQAPKRKKKLSPVIVARARALRRFDSVPEKILWSKLRGGQLNGIKFYRQTPLLGYYADFYCHAAKLVIELDGASHDTQTKHDARRDFIFKKNDYTVLRFNNSDISKNLTAVLESIYTTYCSLSLRERAGVREKTSQNR